MHKMIDEAALKQLIETFYERVRADPLIGPVFLDAVGDWPEHLEKLQAFWSSVMLTSGRYKGQPLPAHIRHGARIDQAAFDRWLALWRQVTDEMFEPAIAARFHEKAERIAESLQLGIRFNPLAAGSKRPPSRSAGQEGAPAFQAP
jgi:hemoglobin